MCKNINQNIKDKKTNLPYAEGRQQVEYDPNQEHLPWAHCVAQASLHLLAVFS